MNVMRPSPTALLLSVICVGCAPSAATNGSNSLAFPDEASLQICMWSWSSDGASASRYVVHLNRKVVASQVDQRTAPKQTPDCAHRRIEKKKHDLRTYNRLLEQFNNQAISGERDKNLVATLEWIEASTKWGASRAGALEASPDGRYAVFSTRSRPVVLINIETLSTRTLAQGHSYLDTPVAWARDSRLVALAVPDTDAITIYKIGDAALSSTKKSYGSRIGALSWSPDMQRIAAFGYQNRRMNMSPLGLLFAAAGHPEFRNDGVLEVYALNDENRWSLLLSRGISEISSANVDIEWK